MQPACKEKKEKLQYILYTYDDVLILFNHIYIPRQDELMYRKESSN